MVGTPGTGVGDGVGIGVGVGVGVPDLPFKSVSERCVQF